MDSNICVNCFKPKAKLECGICKGCVCKSCTVFLDDESFAFLKPIPGDFITKTFCPNCFESNVQPALNSYNEDLEKARNVFVFYKAENKESRHFKKLESAIKVSDVPDREEAILRLAYIAVKTNCNAIIDVDLVSEKVKNGSYQTSKWSGTAFPVEADPYKIEKKSKY